MNGTIKKIDGTFPVTVIDAVAVGDGTSDMLKDWLEDNYINSSKISQVIQEGDEAPISGAAAFTELEKKITINGAVGQLPVCNGDGTISWTTIEWAEEGEF